MESRPCCFIVLALWFCFKSCVKVMAFIFLEVTCKHKVFDLRSLSGPISAILYLGYSLIIALAIMLSTSTIGFLTSFYFVHYLFSSIQID